MNVGKILDISGVLFYLFYDGLMETKMEKLIIQKVKSVYTLIVKPQIVLAVTNLIII